MLAHFPDFLFAYGDAEFIPHDMTPRGLISLALHSSRGSVYLINGDMNQEEIRNAQDAGSLWRRENVWSKLPRLADGSLDQMHLNVVSYADLRNSVAMYFEDVTNRRAARESVGFIADHGTQDMQRVHNLWDNDWSRMPASVPRRPFQDIATLEDISGVRMGRLPNGLELPAQDPRGQHHALRDAEHDKVVHDFLLEHSHAVRVASGVVAV